VYKGSKFSLRTPEEVIADLEEMKEFYGDAVRTVFLQDANPLLTRPDDLVKIVEAVRERFPSASRITAYARSHTLARRKVEDLKRIRQAGLDRIHVGMESGCDEVLKLICKGTTRAEQVKGGQRAKQAGFELSEYIMPGLGGRALTDAHADDSASALVEIQPDFVRLRTTAVIPGTPLFEMQEKGEFEPLTEVELVKEIRRFLAGLKGLTTRLESDHILNLLMELRGDLPGDLEELIGVCDQFLDLDDQLKLKFVLARRMGWMGTLRHLDTPALDKEIDRIVKELKAKGVDPEEVFRELRTRMV
jgi:histone acetyltransferase (RNA polymerase elongator complex component)